MHEHLKPTAQSTAELNQYQPFLLQVLEEGAGDWSAPQAGGRVPDPLGLATGLSDRVIQALLCGTHSSSDDHHELLGN
jgi:hypothetical protein